MERRATSLSLPGEEKKRKGGKREKKKGKRGALNYRHSRCHGFSRVYFRGERDLLREYKRALP